jgi:hypothetical protein
VVGDHANPLRAPGFDACEYLAHQENPLVKSIALHYKPTIMELINEPLPEIKPGKGIVLRQPEFMPRTILRQIQIFLLL